MKKTLLACLAVAMLLFIACSTQPSGHRAEDNLARTLLDSYSTGGMEALNRDYIARNVSPGGSADMVALTVFIHAILN